MNTKSLIQLLEGGKMSRRIIDLNTRPGIREGWLDFWKDFGTVIVLCVLSTAIAVMALLF